MPNHKPGSMSREQLIAALSDEIAPVRRVRPREGAALITFATAIAGLGAIAIFGFWSGMITGAASPFFWIGHGLLALVGAASTSALVASALPRVGPRSCAPAWSGAMLAVLPLAALITLVSLEAGHDHGMDLQDTGLQYWECALYGLAASLIVALAAIVHLRRGAPVAIERAGWLIGLASGSLGALAYGITCPIDGFLHIAIWHVVPVFAAALFWRMAAPPLIRW
ncbi:MAG: DUF1109 domain-containing protein [Erythrobacter sp.]|jgi:hypothetical protein|nr:DUF1109 domain-containing protein [Erythrobacter sp.]